MLMQLQNRQHVVEAFLTDMSTSPDITWSHEKPSAFVNSTGISVSYRKYQICKGKRYDLHQVPHEHYEFKLHPNARVKRFLKEQEFIYGEVSVFAELLTICRRYDKLKVLGS